MLNSSLYMSFKLFQPRGKSSSQDSSCKFAAKEKPQTTETAYFHQQRHHLSSYPENCFGWPRHPVWFSCCLIECRAIEIADEQLQKEVYLAKEAFFLPVQDSDSESDSAWNDMNDKSDTEV